MTASPPRRDRPPALPPPRRFILPQPQAVELPGGAQLLVVTDRRLPLLALDWVLPAGAQHDAPAVAGRAALTASLLDEGTKEYSGVELSDRIEGLGAELGSSADWDATYVGCSAMAEHLESALEILLEVVIHPTFPESEVDRCRRLRLAELQQRRDRPSRLAADRVARVLYSGTAYGAPLLGLTETVSALVRSDLAAFHTERLQISGSTLIAVGDLDPDRVATLVGRTLAARAGSEREPAPKVEAQPLAGRRIHIVDRPGASQTELRVAHAGPPRQDPDWPVLKLLSILLGGQFTSRLMTKLREQRGLTYGVSSHFSARRGPGPFTVATAVATEGVGVAVADILEELERLRQEPPSADELRESCDYLIGVIPQRFESIDDVASQLAAIVVHDLGHDYFERFEAIHRAVTPDRILEAARRHLQPDRCAIVAVGPEEALRSQLEPFGAVD